MTEAAPIRAARRSEVVRVDKQWNASLGRETLPKYGSVDDIVLFPPAKQALERIPVSLRMNAGGYVFLSPYERHFTGPNLHYSWHPVRVAFGRPALRFDAFRHYAASWMANTLRLDERTIARQLRNSPEVARTYYIHDDPKWRERARGAFYAANKPRIVAESA
jgi:integrase